MNTTTAQAFTLPSAAPAAARTVFALLRKLQHGTLDVQMPDGAQARFGSGAPDQPKAALRLIGSGVEWRGPADRRPSGECDRRVGERERFRERERFFGEITGGRGPDLGSGGGGGVHRPRRR